MKLVPFLVTILLVVGMMTAGGLVLYGVVHHQTVAGHARDQQERLLNAKIVANRLHGCALLDAIPAGRSPIVDTFRNSPYPVKVLPDGRFLTAPYCPSP